MISAMVTEELLEARRINWDHHPIVSGTAVLPTGPIGWVLSLILSHGRRQRSGLAFWAHPLTGKSSCIEVIEQVVPKYFPGCGVLVHEAKSNTILAEGTFITDILRTMNYEPRVRNNLADKRDQLHRALYALGAGARQIFFLIDEAQELAEKELRWLKEAVNWLVRRRYKVTIVLFGQAELIAVRDELVATGRSDLHVRFTANLREFEGIREPTDIRPLLHGCDETSEYPSGSGWSYTQFLWPRAFAAGFRLANEERSIWTALRDELTSQRSSRGIGMHYVAATLAEFADLTREKDSATFAPSIENWRRAVELSGFVNRQPLVCQVRSSMARTKRT